MKKVLCVLTVFFCSLSINAHSLVERALNLELITTDKEIVVEAYEICGHSFQKVKEGNYEEALVIVLAGIEKFPNNFTLQTKLATLLGDFAGEFTGVLKETMLEKSKALFNKLMNESEGWSQPDLFYLRNEYYYRFAHYKSQYELGLEKIAHYEGTEKWHSRASNCYYSQGVGAAHYAKELLMQGNPQLALEYAQKAVVAWAQHFSYENSYYNSYVHYALALGILGCKDDMIRALHRGAELTKRDLDYCEFREVIEFVNGLDSGSSGFCHYWQA